MIFLNSYFEKVDFEKIQQKTKKHAKFFSWQLTLQLMTVSRFFRSSVSVGEVTGSGLWEKEPVSGTEDYVRYLSVYRRSDIRWGFRSWEDKVQEFRRTAANHKGYKGKEYIEDIYFLGVNTKYISSGAVKKSVIFTST